MHETGDEDHQRRGADLNINIRTPKNKEYRLKKTKSKNNPYLSGWLCGLLDLCSMTPACHSNLGNRSGQDNLTCLLLVWRRAHSVSLYCIPKIMNHLIQFELLHIYQKTSGCNSTVIIFKLLSHLCTCCEALPEHWCTDLVFTSGLVLTSTNVLNTLNYKHVSKLRNCNFCHSSSVWCCALCNHHYDCCWPNFKLKKYVYFQLCTINGTIDVLVNFVSNCINNNRTDLVMVSTVA